MGRAVMRVVITSQYVERWLPNQEVDAKRRYRPAMPKGKKAKKNGKQQKETTGGRRSGQDITHGSSLTHDSMRDNGKPGKRGREGERDGRRTIAREGDNNVRVVPRGGRRKGNATIRKKRAAQGGAGPAKAPAHRKINERGHARQWTMALFRAGGHLFFVVSLPRPQSQTLPSECAVSALPASHSQSFLCPGGRKAAPQTWVVWQEPSPVFPSCTVF